MKENAANRRTLLPIQRILIVCLVVLLVFPLFVGTLVAYAADDESSSDASSSSSSDAAASSSSGPSATEEVVTSPEVTQESTLQKLYADVTKYTSDGNPEMLTLTYLEILVYIYENGYDADKGTANDSEFGKMWAISVDSSVAVTGGKPWKEHMLEVFGDGSDEHPGSFFTPNAFHSATIEAYTNKPFGRKEDFSQDVVHGSYSWVVGLEDHKKWVDNLKTTKQQEEAEWDAWAQTFPEDWHEALAKIKDDSLKYQSMEQFAIDSDDSEAYSLQAYIYCLSKALQRYQMMYIAAACSDVLPCPFTGIKTKTMFSGSKEGKIVKFEDFDLKDEYIRKLLGVTDANEKTLTDEQKAAVEAAAVPIHGAADYCTSKCFDLIGIFAEDKSEYAREVTTGDILQKRGVNHTDVVTFVTRTKEVLKKVPAITYKGTDNLREEGEFLLYGGVLQTLSKGVEKLFKGAVKVLFGWEWRSSYQHASSMVTYYKWIQQVVQGSIDDSIDGNSQQAEDDRRIGLEPEILYNFITRSDTDTSYSMKENILTGIACSALFRPLQTNINDFDFKGTTESANFMEFQNKYGSLRKALLISESSDSVAQYFRTGEISNLRTATLNDLVLNPNSDKLLLVHDSYYNTEGINVEVTKDILIANDDLSFTLILGVGGEIIGEVFEQAVDATSEAMAAASEAAESDASSEDAPKTEKKKEEKTENTEADAFTLADKFNKSFKNWKEHKFEFSADTIYDSVLVGLSKTFRKYVINSVNDDKINMAGVNPSTGLSISLSILEHLDLAITMNNPLYSSAPIYMSTSRDIDDIDDTVYYNYLMLKNISKNQPIRYSSAMDRSSPLFVDIYGNILTESGVVVIPIAANASMANCVYDTAQRSHANSVNWLTAANLLFYGDSEYIKKDSDSVTTIAGRPVSLSTTSWLDVAQYLPSVPAEGDTNIFVYDKQLNRYYLNPVILPVTAGNFSTNINIALLNAGDPEVMKALYRVNRAAYDKNISPNIALNLPKWMASIMYQVTRGAKMSEIDYEKEGIITPKKFSNGTLAQAAKFEDFHSSIVMENSNSLLSMPNIMYMDGFADIIFIVFRIMCIVTVVALIFQIYQQAIKSKLNLFTFLKLLGNMLLVICIVFLVPMVFELTYYQANRAFLQDEALTVAALNAEKRNSGVELGVAAATRTDSLSEIMILISEVDVNWFDYLRDLLADPNIVKMQDIYEKYVDSIPVSSESFQLKGNKVYLSIDDLFESSTIQTDFTSHRIRQLVDENPDSSFYLPYYAIIDYMLYNINQFNAVTDTYSYDKYYYGDGRLRSVGLLKNYYLSDAFLITAKDITDPSFVIPDNINELTLEMSGYDKVGLNQFYGNKAADNRSIFTSTEGFKASQWYAEGKTQQQLRDISTNLDKEAIQFVLENEELIGRISDETFIKMFALHMSLKFNQEMGVGGPKSLEIFNFNNEDIARLTISRTADVMQGSPFSYPKFILEQLGLVGIYAAALLDFVILAASFIKPAATVFIFIAMLLSIFVYKCLLHKDSDNLKGLAILTILISLGNVLYSVALKFSIMLPNVGLPSFVCLLLQIVFQYAYIAFYLFLSVIVLRNWKDLGAGTFSNMASMKSVKMKDVAVDDFKVNRSAKDESDHQETHTNQKAGWDLYNEMHHRDDITYNKDDDDDDSY